MDKIQLRRLATGALTTGVAAGIGAAANSSTAIGATGMGLLLSKIAYDHLATKYPTPTQKRNQHLAEGAENARR